MLELRQLYGFGLGMLRIRHSRRNKGCLKFLNTKPIHFPSIKVNWEDGSVGHKEKMLRRTRVAKLTRTMLWVILSECAISYHM
jgi:hypothetical protein